MDPRTPNQPVAQWQYHAIADGPEPHSEFDARSLPVAPGFRLVGARVRGRKHKHDGTNCDDWFEFAVAGPWTIIAVADGAGVKAFSRIGARAACTAAVAHLAAALADHRIAERTSPPAWSQAIERDDPTRVFHADDLQHTQEALHAAMHAACTAVEDAHRTRIGEPVFESALGRPLELADLATTLLTAVHTTIPFQGRELSFALTCQAGNGIAAAIGRKHNLVLLGQPESGNFAGQTEFLSKSLNFAPRTFSFLGSLQALLLMTDGVGDDYFPSDPALLRLWGDLVVNRLLDMQGPDDALCTAALAKTPVRDREGLAKTLSPQTWRYEDAAAVHEVRAVTTPSLAAALDVPLNQMLLQPALLWPAGAGETLASGLPAVDRLRTWLDAYQVRGSHDDRTLVVLHREEYG